MSRRHGATDATLSPEPVVYVVTAVPCGVDSACSERVEYAGLDEELALRFAADARGKLEIEYASEELAGRVEYLPAVYLYYCNPLPQLRRTWSAFNRFTRAASFVVSWKETDLSWKETSLFSYGTRVRAVVLRDGKGDYTDEAIAARKRHDGKIGIVRELHNSHGHCYGVEFDGSVAFFDPEELEVIR